MPDAPDPARQAERAEPESRTNRASSPRSDEEQRVWDVLEEARQNVKQLTKRELEAELLPSELMSFRLKSGR
jgi:hypothetical protein